MARVSALTGELILDINKWTAGVRQAQTDAGALGKSLRPITDIAAAAGVALLGVATAAVGALTTVTKIAADYGDSMADASIRTGLSTEALSGLKIQAEQSGTSFEALNNGLKLLSRNMLEGIQRSGEQRRAFTSIGISVKDLKDANGDLEPILRKVSDRFSELPNGATKAALAQQLMGRSGTELIEVLSAGSEGMDEFRRKAELFGLALSGEAATNAKRFNDSINDLKQAFTGLAVQIGSIIIPHIHGYVVALTASTITVAQNIAGFLELIATIRESITSMDFLRGSVLAAGQAKKLLGNITVDYIANLTELLGSTFAAIDAEKLRGGIIDDLTEQTKKLKEAEAERIKLMGVYIDLTRTAMAFEDERAQALTRGVEAIEQSVAASLEAIKPLAGPVDQEMQKIIDRAKTSVEQFPGVWAEEMDKTKLVIFDEMGNIVREVEVGNDKLSESARRAAEQTRMVWATAVGNITSDFTQGLADVIFEGKKFGDAMVDIAKDTAKAMFSAFLTGLLAPLTSKLAGLGSQLGDVLFGGGGKQPGGGAIGGVASAGGGILGGIFGGGAAAGGGIAQLGLFGAMGPVGAALMAAPLIGKLIGSIGAGREAADKIVQSQNELQRQVESVLADVTLSATNRSKIVENLFSGFQSNAQAFAAGGGSNATVANQAFATLLPWMTNIRSGLAREMQGADTGGGAQTINNYNVTIVVPEGKNARATVALFQTEGIPTFINWIQNNTGGITAAVTVAVKNSLAGVTTTA